MCQCTDLCRPLLLAAVGRRLNRFLSSLLTMQRLRDSSKPTASRSLQSVSSAMRRFAFAKQRQTARRLLAWEGDEPCC